MHKPRIIFFDIDGTLIDMEKKRITERTLDALRRLQQNGILLAIATGRSPLIVPKFDGVEFDVFLTYNGLGLSVAVPSLGNLINDGRKVMMQAGLRYQLLYPTIILSFVTIAFYLIGNAFSDAADPKNHLQ